MADPQQSADAGAQESECLPCRGSGQVSSLLGGETSIVPCPWCEGTGVRRAGIDAQARWLQDGAEQPATQTATAETSAEV